MFINNRFFRPIFACALALLFLASLLISLPRFASATSLANKIVGTAQRGNFFTPSFTTIQPGDTVTFTNSGGGFHNVVFDDSPADGSLPDNFEDFNASTDEWVKPVTFDQPGRYYFFCDPHRDVNMVGVVVVVGDVQATQTPTATATSPPPSELYIYLPLIEKE